MNPKAETKQEKYYGYGEVDDFGEKVTDMIIDGKTRHGPWAYMTPKSFWQHGIGLGEGMGQAYQKNGKQWIKTDVVPRQ